MMCLLFGTNALLFALFQIINTNSKNPSVELVETKKKLSKPFLGSVECFTNLTTELFRTGLIVALTYICEKHWFFEHSGKSYSRDLFFFVLLIFFAYAFYTIKPVQDLSLLGREQTEEWKGWMQFIFLLYHYFNAAEVYNSVRVMITCYVWMTGFGNFSFFYIKQDFGWLRVVQMLWRLNFSVVLLMWAHGNTWILYYICPMHTFYFLMVYVTMRVFSKWNNSKWGIRVKLMMVAVIIYIVWDVNEGMFDYIFAWLGTDKIIGAKSGAVWEWYFRTSLDHWSTFLGMIFALNFPLAEQFFTKAKGLPLVCASMLMGGLALWWIVNCFFLDKLAYNLSHSYCAIIPLIAYIFFRNITPYVRSGVSMSLHELGKTTLETYLLQHHIWLSSNAKTLLTVIPGHPWMNFAVVTFAFFMISKELYRLTMSIRGMILPDDKQITWNNCIGMSIMLALLYIVSLALYAFKPTVIELLFTCVILMLVTLVFISRFMKTCSDSFIYQQWSSRAIKLSTVILVVGVSLKLSIADRGVTVVKQEMSYPPPSAPCLEAISSGHWSKVPCTSTHSRVVVCATDTWEWAESNECHLEKLTTKKMRWVFQGMKVAFVGDSVLRNSYYQFISLLDPSYTHNHSSMHSNIAYSPSFDLNMTVNFVWAPYIGDIATYLAATDHSDMSTIIVAGAGFWDALHKRDVSAYKQSLDKIASTYGSEKSNRIWVLPTTVRNELLPTAEKRTYMTQEILSTYREAFESSEAFKKLFMTVVDPSMVTKGQLETVDGVHYSEKVYTVIAHMLANAYMVHYPVVYHSTPPTALSTKPYVPRRTGSMSNPTYGAYMLLLTFIMIFFMDSWLGIGVFSLSIFGRSYDWDAAYSALHNKINASLTPKPPKEANTPEQSA